MALRMDLHRRNRLQGPPDLVLVFSSFPYPRIVVAELFGKGTETAPAFVSLLGSMKGAQAFVSWAELGDTGIGSLFLYLTARESAGSHFVATDSRMRGLGYGGVTVSMALDELDRRGVRFAVA